MKVIKQKTRTLITRDNGRSSDAVSPNFIYGCLGGCMNSYCYVGRFNHDRVYLNENTNDLLGSVDRWVNSQQWPKKPNQCDEKYYVIDIGCSTDIPLMRKHYDWQKVFDYFNDGNEMAKSTFATKYPSLFLPESYNLKKEKHRIRVSLMPQKYSNVLEPGTDKISKRIAEIPRLMEHLEVHINFSPIICTEGWSVEYDKLFAEVKSAGIDTKCECIFLTHNIHQHNRNSEDVQNLLWRPEMQESKNSQYAPDNIRYRFDLKRKMINHFIKLYGNHFDPVNIRYIF